MKIEFTNTKRLVKIMGHEYPKSYLDNDIIDIAKKSYFLIYDYQNKKTNKMPASLILKMCENGEAKIIEEK